MRIGIVGNGVVGSATARCYMEQHEVRIWDGVDSKKSHCLADTLDSDLVFVCLPESSLDTFFDFPKSDKKARTRNYVIKSTVPIGTTRRLAEKYDIPTIVHSPEFLTARRAFVDAQCPARNIIGYPHWNFQHGTSGDYATYLREFTQPHERAFVTLLKLYEERFPGVTTYYVRSDESEAIKLAVNSFFAVKVAFFNEVNLLCEELGLDWNRVLEGILSDGRIAHSHTQVPGPDGKYGFGGACLPKDVAHLFAHISKDGVPGNGYSIVGSALMRNLEDRKRVPK